MYLKHARWDKDRTKKWKLGHYFVRCKLFRPGSWRESKGLSPAGCIFSPDPPRMVDAAVVGPGGKTIELGDHPSYAFPRPWMSLLAEDSAIDT